jgi:hypothetical protein
MGQAMLSKLPMWRSRETLHRASGASDVAAQYAAEKEFIKPLDPGPH